MPPSVHSTVIPMGPLAARLSGEDAGHLLSVGGGECDYCKRTRQELGMDHLKICTRCRKAFYCSSDCQRNQWNAGHKEFCRKPGQIETGDYVRLEGLHSRRDLNGTVVQIIRPLPNQPGRFGLLQRRGCSSFVR